jgi:hypothetical protein
MSRRMRVFRKPRRNVGGRLRRSARLQKKHRTYWLAWLKKFTASTADCPEATW